VGLNNNRECGSGSAEGCRQFGVPSAFLGSNLDKVPYRLSKLKRLPMIVRVGGRPTGKQTARPHPVSQLIRCSDFIASRMWGATLNETAQVERVHKLVQQRQLRGDRIFFG
jgi:hypothetical protein